MTILKAPVQCKKVLSEMVDQKREAECKWGHNHHLRGKEKAGSAKWPGQMTAIGWGVIEWHETEPIIDKFVACYRIKNRWVPAIWALNWGFDCAWPNGCCCDSKEDQCGKEAKWKANAIKRKRFQVPVQLWKRAEEHERKMGRKRRTISPTFVWHWVNGLALGCTAIVIRFWLKVAREKAYSLDRKENFFAPHVKKSFE